MEIPWDYSVLPGDVSFFYGGIVIIVPLPYDLIVQRMVQQIDIHQLEDFELGVVLWKETDIVVRDFQPRSACLGGIQHFQRLLHYVQRIRIFKLVSKYNLFVRQGVQVGIPASVRPGHFVRAAGERQQGRP